MSTRVRVSGHAEEELRQRAALAGQSPEQYARALLHEALRTDPIGALAEAARPHVPPELREPWDVVPAALRSALVRRDPQGLTDVLVAYCERKTNGGQPP